VEKQDLAKGFNNAFDNLATILMFLSFVGMSFLLISATVSLIGEFVKAEQDGWLIFLEVFVFALEIALAAVFVDIHRRGVGVLVGFKNFWHFATIVAVIFMTFQIEKTSIAYGLSYLQSHYLKKDALKYKDIDGYKSAVEAKRKARKKIEQWEKYEGSEADRLMITQLKQKYDAAVKEKEFRLKNYKHATTKKADKEIAEALAQLKAIEDRIEAKRNKNIDLFSQVEKMAIKQIEQIEKNFKSKQKHELLSFSAQAEKWAHDVVIFMAMIYFIHGILIVVSEDDFVAKEWIVRLFPVLEKKIDKIEEEAAKIVTSEAPAKEKPIPFSIKDSDEGLSKTLKRKIVEDAVFSVYKDFWNEYGYSDTKFPHVSRDRARNIINQGIQSGIYDEGFSMPNSELGKMVAEANHKCRQIAIKEAQKRAG